MKIKIITVTSKKNQFKDEIDRYFKLLPPFMKIEQLELSISKRSKQKSVQKNLQEESIKIFNHVDPSDYLISMDEKGKQIDTIQFSQWLKRWMDEGIRPTFVIGGPDGLAQSIKKKGNVSLSLSSLTYAHSMVPLILAEQIYRAWSIIDNQPYHRS